MISGMAPGNPYNVTIVSKCMLLCGLIPLRISHTARTKTLMQVEGLRRRNITEKNLVDKYTFNVQVVEIKYSGEGLGREVILVLKDSVTRNKTRTKGPYDRVICISSL